jgi:hypothetical protein
MNKELMTFLVSSAFCSIALHAQTTSVGSSFQPPSWVHSGSPSQGRIEGVQTGPVLGRPFSAIEIRRTQQVLGDGTKVDRSDTSKFYRDNQGRMRAESPERIEIFDFVSGVEYDLHPRGKTYQKIAIKNNSGMVTVAVVGGLSVTGSTTTETEHAQGEDIGTQLIGGVTANGRRVTVTIPVGAFGNNRELKVVNERWYSPELQALVKSSNSDPRFGVNTYELTNIVRGNLDPALFQPPSDYTLKSRNH